MARSPEILDYLVLGTVNASWRAEVDAHALAEAILGDTAASPWVRHAGTFFSEVRTGLILEFAQNHRIPLGVLASSYAAVKGRTQEQNKELEEYFVAMGSPAGSCAKGD